MKYFVRILAFLFISFSFGFCKGSIHPIKELLYYTNEITSFEVAGKIFFITCGNIIKKKV